MKILGFLDEEVELRTFDSSEFQRIKYKPQHITESLNTPNRNYDPLGPYVTHISTGNGEGVGTLKDGREVEILSITND